MFLGSLGWFPELTKIRHLQYHGLLPGLLLKIGQFPTLGNYAQIFTSNVARSWKSICKHVGDVPREFETISGTSQNPPSSKPGAIDQGLCSKSANLPQKCKCTCYQNCAGNLNQSHLEALPVPCSGAAGERRAEKNQDQVPSPSADFWEVWHRFAKPENCPIVALRPLEMSSYMWDGTSKRASCVGANIKSSHSPASMATTRAVPHLWTPMRTLAAR